ncbi:MAG TPA: peroxidase-related enzyme [Burkholderiaceae bacterium]|nr:peroxidase-related enzyme [Burkholderiaceae bacterium]
MTSSISRYPVPELKDLPDDMRERMLQVQEKAGFIPNVFLALAHRPEEFRAFVAYHDALMLRPSGLTNGAVLRIYEKAPLLADQIATNHLKADITPRQKAMLAFAVKICRDSASVVDSELEALRAEGFSDEDIWDIGAISAFFGLSNRMADLMALRQP